MKYNASILQPAFDPAYALRIAARLKPSTTYSKGQAVGELTTPANHVVSITGSTNISGGTYTLTFRGYTTADIAASAAASTVQAAFRALLPVGSNCNVTGGALNTTNALAFTFVTDLGYQPIESPAITASSLTGSTVTTTAVSTVGGGAGTMAPYDDTNSDGSNIAKGVMEMACKTDALGRITFGDVNTGDERGHTELTAPVFIRGYFRIADLVGLDANGIADLGRVVLGSTTTGVLGIV
jgi:hypothetical protein